MYGLVNKAIQDLVTSKFGVEVWEEIANRVGVDDTGFVSMDPYPDEMTHGLVAAASEVLEQPADELLEAFGEHWTLYTAREGYGDLMDISGDSFSDFLENLDNLHSRIALSFPELCPPAFRCEQQGEGRLLLHYHSRRDRLAPLVRGMVRGLASMFKVKISIEQIEFKSNDTGHDAFLITHEARQEHCRT